MVSATRAAKDPDWAFVPLGAIFLSLSEMWHMSKPVKKSVFCFFSIFWVIPETCPNLVMAFVFKVLRNRLLRYRVETCPVSRPVMAFLFKVLRNRLLRHRLGTCPNLWWRLCSKCRAIDCFVQTWNMSSVQTCDGVPVQSATQPTASVQTWNMSKPVMTFVFKVLRKRLLRADLTTCPVSRPVMAFLFKVLRNRLLRYRLGTCPNLWWRLCSKCYAIDCFVQTWQHVQCPDLWWRSCSKCYATDCFGTYLKHVQTCDDVRVQSATQSTASVLDTCSKPVITFMAVSHMFGIFLGPWWRMLCNPVKTMYILYIMTKYLWELRDSERARPRTRNVVV